MQAGRELDAKVAEALGWKSAIDGDGAKCWEDQKGCLREAAFSTTWEGMGVLVEEARKKEIFITIVPAVSGYHAEIFAFGTKWGGSAQSAPFAASLLFYIVMTGGGLMRKVKFYETEAKNVKLDELLDQIKTDIDVIKMFSNGDTLVDIKIVAHEKRNL